MAQPVFEQHPLQNYFRDVGEALEILPGGIPEFVPDSDSEQDLQLSEDSPFLAVFEYLRSLVFASNTSNQISPFVERFKYDVISSSLLASSISTPHPTGRHSLSHTIPGRLTPGQSSTSQTPDRSSPVLSQRRSNDHTPPDYSWPTTLVFAITLATFISGYYLISALLFGGALYIMYHDKLDMTSKPAITSSLGTLNDLIVSGDVWNSVVREAITVLENEEKTIFFGPSSPSSPSSSLRVALHSSLHTTQTQCDNIRRLFSALTAPAELSQLSEMYAPPSPMKPTFSDLDDVPRLLSLPSSRKRTISVPPELKRSTWNGSYASLAHAGSPTMQVLRHREKRRSDIYSLLELNSPTRSTVSAPVTPSFVLPSLSGVLEEKDPAGRELSLPDETPELSFGIVALDLQRKRTANGLEALRSPPSSSFLSLRHGSPTMSSASRFTRMQTTRHPLSLSALHHALQGAISSKRFACAHLLALRFNEEDDEGYWEDVRSVMGLLTTTFADASSRLTDALEQVEKDKLRDENPSADSLPSHSRTGSGSVETNGRKGSNRQPPSFAPMPTNLSRFAAHVDTITTALKDARDHLEQCVASLQDEPAPQDPPSPSTPPPPSSPAVLQEAPALRAYELLRRELGLALRECERGRERLLDILAPRNESNADIDPDDLPALGHDVGSDESDKQDSTSPILDPPDDYAGGPGRFAVIRGGEEEGEAREDDATTHLLLTTSSRHLPPPGIEQVFETDTGSGALFSRERSKLTREERIRLVKARRESGGGLRFDVGGEPMGPPPSHMEKWGPGGEVVQELKDVIWKVGERRRRMTEGANSDGFSE